jgi:adenylate cyclase
MDPAIDLSHAPRRERWAIAATVFAPLLPQMAGSWFNIWYNLEVVTPLLQTKALEDRFKDTVLVYNTTIYPLAMALWVWLVLSLRQPFRELWAGRTIERERLAKLRRRVINLPWWCALITAAGWLLCIPVFLISLTSVGDQPDPTLFWHLPVSIIVSALISMTHSFFLVEVASHWGLFRVFFRDVRADTTSGGFALSLRWRGVLWAISAGICPIGSLLLLSFAPPGSDPRWFAVFVGTVGIAFGLLTALLISRLVAGPIDLLREAAQTVADGRLDVQVAAPRPDEFGQLISVFNDMVAQLKDKERLRQTFGLHVGQAAAEQILSRDPGLGGVEQIVTVMFVDIRSFTARSSTNSAQRTVRELNEFLRVMVDVVEGRHHGMINKFLGDGFMALFGVGKDAGDHADRALMAGREMLRALDQLNRELTASGGEPMRIGIGIHTGTAIVGSIGSPQRLEFTAIGSTVNLAARIEQLTKSVDASLLITEACAKHLKTGSDLVEAGAHPVRGVDEPVRVFTVPALA